MAEVTTYILQFKGIIKITAVNCNAQKKICDEYGIKDFPTLKVVFPLALLPTKCIPACTNACTLANTHKNADSRHPVY